MSKPVSIRRGIERVFVTTAIAVTSRASAVTPSVPAFISDTDAGINRTDPHLGQTEAKKSRSPSQGLNNGSRTNDYLASSSAPNSRVTKSSVHREIILARDGKSQRLFDISSGAETIYSTANPSAVAAIRAEAKKAKFNHTQEVAAVKTNLGKLDNLVSTLGGQPGDSWVWDFINSDPQNRDTVINVAQVQTQILAEQLNWLIPQKIHEAGLNPQQLKALSRLEPGALRQLGVEPATFGLSKTQLEKVRTAVRQMSETLAVDELISTTTSDLQAQLRDLSNKLPTDPLGMVLPEAAGLAILGVLGTQHINKKKLTTAAVTTILTACVGGAVSPTGTPLPPHVEVSTVTPEPTVLPPVVTGTVARPGYTGALEFLDNNGLISVPGAERFNDLMAIRGTTLNCAFTDEVWEEMVQSNGKAEVFRDEFLRAEAALAQTPVSMQSLECTVRADGTFDLYYVDSDGQVFLPTASGMVPGIVNPDGTVSLYLDQNVTSFSGSSGEYTFSVIPGAPAGAGGEGSPQQLIENSLELQKMLNAQGYAPIIHQKPVRLENGNGTNTLIIVSTVLERGGIRVAELNLPAILYNPDLPGGKEEIVGGQNGLIYFGDKDTGTIRTKLLTSVSLAGWPEHITAVSAIVTDPENPAGKGAIRILLVDTKEFKILGTLQGAFNNAEYVAYYWSDQGPVIYLNGQILRFTLRDGVLLPTPTLEPSATIEPPLAPQATQPPTQPPAPTEQPATPTQDQQVNPTSGPPSPEAPNCTGRTPEGRVFQVSTDLYLDPNKPPQDDFTNPSFVGTVRPPSVFYPEGDFRRTTYLVWVRVTAVDLTSGIATVDAGSLGSKRIYLTGVIGTLTGRYHVEQPGGGFTNPCSRSASINDLSAEIAANYNGMTSIGDLINVYIENKPEESDWKFVKSFEVFQ